MIHEAIQNRSSFNVIHLATMFKVDIFLLKADVASQEELRRRGKYQISDTPNQRLFVASAADVLGVLQVQGEQLDYPYLEHMAHQRGVHDLLIQAMKDAKQGGI